MRRRRARREQGYALLITLVVIFLLSIALGLLGAALQLRLGLVRRESQAVRHQALSDAALAEAVAHLAHSASFRGVGPHPFGGGTISSEVAPAGWNLYEIEAIATFAGRRRVVRADVVRSDETTRVVRWRPVSE